MDETVVQRQPMDAGPRDRPAWGSRPRGWTTCKWLAVLQPDDLKRRQEFRVETVLSPDDTGSLLTMTFNEFGDVLASKEGAGILLVPQYE